MSVSVLVFCSLLLRKSCSLLLLIHPTAPSSSSLHFIPQDSSLDMLTRLMVLHSNTDTFVTSAHSPLLSILYLLLDLQAIFQCLLVCYSPAEEKFAIWVWVPLKQTLRQGLGCRQFIWKAIQGSKRRNTESKTSRNKSQKVCFNECDTSVDDWGSNPLGTHWETKIDSQNHPSERQLGFSHRTPLLNDWGLPLEERRD